ncbi:MAG: helix-turn-helix transcriptional regulator [Lachnospiraceae bacterium]|nr:helix-turn-helix transcriptional regulator [Lachnospiraceae bacterium]
MKIYDYNGKANIVGKRIYALRKKAHLSQEELAIKMQLNNIELSQKAISRIEKQERFVTDYELMVFAMVFQVDIKDLFQ